MAAQIALVLYLGEAARCIDCSDSMIKVGFKKRSLFISLLLGSLAFIAAAIFGWDLPAEKALNFLIMSVLLLAIVVAAAFVAVVLLKALRRLF